MKKKTREEGGQPRQLCRWNVDKDQLLLLCLADEAAKQGIALPWETVGRLFDPPVTPEAIKQHLSKVCSAREEAGLAVPGKGGRPVCRGGRKTTTTSSSKPRSSLLPPVEPARRISTAPRRSSSVAKGPAPSSDVPATSKKVAKKSLKRQRASLEQDDDVISIDSPSPEPPRRKKQKILAPPVDPEVRQLLGQASQLINTASTSQQSTTRDYLGNVYASGVPRVDLLSQDVESYTKSEMIAAAARSGIHPESRENVEAAIRHGVWREDVTFNVTAYSAQVPAPAVPVLSLQQLVPTSTVNDLNQQLAITTTDEADEDLEQQIFASTTPSTDFLTATTQQSNDTQFDEILTTIGNGGYFDDEATIQQETDNDTNFASNFHFVNLTVADFQQGHQNRTPAPSASRSLRQVSARPATARDSQQINGTVPPISRPVRRQQAPAVRNPGLRQPTNFSRPLTFINPVVLDRPQNHSLSTYTPAPIDVDYSGSLFDPRTPRSCRPPVEDHLNINHFHGGESFSLGTRVVDPAGESTAAGLTTSYSTHPTTFAVPTTGMFGDLNRPGLPAASYDGMNNDFLLPNLPPERHVQAWRQSQRSNQAIQQTDEDSQRFDRSGTLERDLVFLATIEAFDIADQTLEEQQNGGRTYVLSTSTPADDSRNRN